MKSLKFSFFLLVHNKVRCFDFEPSISEMDYMYCALETEGSNGVDFTLSEDELLKVGQIQYKLLLKQLQDPRYFSEMRG